MNKLPSLTHQTTGDKAGRTHGDAEAQVSSEGSSPEPSDAAWVSANRRPEGPELERTVTLTDGVVAIAMTLLILPLVDLLDANAELNLAELWRDDSQTLVSFVVSFVVIWTFWNAHGSLFRRLATAGLSDVPWLGQLNLCWLLVIAFLPFSTALVGREVTTGTAPVYLGTMLLLSALASAMTVVVQRAAGEPRRLAWLTTAVIGVCTTVSFFDARLGMYLLLLLIVCGRLEAHLVERKRDHEATSIRHTSRTQVNRQARS